MANVLINDTSMTSIGDAIRSKLGVETTYLPSEMASAIQSIPSGGAASDTMIERTATSITNSTASVVGQYAFYRYTGLDSVNLTSVTNIGSYAFYGAIISNTISVPNVTNIGFEAFFASTIPPFSAPSCTVLDREVFRESHVVSVDLPRVTTLRNQTGDSGVFGMCQWLETVNIPSVKTVGDYTFFKCSKLTSLQIPKATSIGNHSFDGCTRLTSVVIGTEQSSVATCGTADVFNNTPIESGTGYIYVPDNLVNQYKSASGWSTYASQIKGISEIS